jgi:hypothetical protein
VEAPTEEQSEVGVLEGEVGVEGLNKQGESDESTRVILKPGFQTSAFKLQKPIMPVPLKEQMLKYVVKIELLRKKAVDIRQDLPKIMENRIKIRQNLIEKWKNSREQNLLLLKPQEELGAPGFQGGPGDLNGPPPPPIQGGLNGLPPLSPTPQIQKLPIRTTPTTLPPLQSNGIRKLPPSNLRKLPVRQSGPGPVLNNQTSPPAGVIGNLPPGTNSTNDTGNSGTTTLMTPKGNKVLLIKPPPPVIK